ncbi:ABC transporter permease [Rossellomorea vietnamensis]|uniref:ABC transporter permease n=2 Tax=Rossellomorea TaxID=2837508 RepID=A0A5D4KE94_9BACI|nr:MULTISPECIES: ABC transporter permease [Rossellomorea]TYR74523.1 ABC transporter permease [Rossellomorea vietnamensis]TYS75086.1 ABC transporter permease [Rossellomorea aquimaris]
MRAYWQLTLAQLRIFARNKQVLLFTLLFPIILMLALGSLVGKENSVSLSAGVVDLDQTAASNDIKDLFYENKAVETESFENVETGKKAVENGDIQLLIEIPAGYGENLKGENSAFSLPVYYNEKNLENAELGITVINGIIDQYSKDLVDYQPLVTVEKVGIEALNLRYVDFLVPGIVALMILNNNMNGVAGQISAWRERGILRRMQGTRLKASTFIAAQISARLMLNGTQALLVVLIANLIFGINVAGSWLALIFFIILGTLTFMSLGFVIAGMAKNPESAGPIAAFVTFPLLFLGGVFFPVSDMPEMVQPVVNILPIAHLSSALREIMNLGTPFLELGTETLILGVWLVGGFMLASYVFKWE